MVLTSTGTKLSVVAAVPATFTEAGFDALTFVEVGEVTSIPEFGPNVQVVTHEPLATGVTEKYKGFINYGSLALEAAYDDGDAGQGVMSDAVTGATQNDEHSFKIEMQDGSVRYFTGKVFSYTENPGAANSMVACSMQLEINSPVLKVAAP
jgi:hypothetical protein